MPGRVCLGVVELLVDELEEDEVEVEVEVEVDVEVEELVDEVEELLVGWAAVVVVDDEAAGVQDSVSDWTTPVIGRCIDEIGVPGGTLT